MGGVWMKQLAQAIFHSRNKQTEKVYSRPLPKVGIIAQAWDLASTISYGGIQALVLARA